MQADARQRFRDELGELVRSAGLRDQADWDRAASLVSDQRHRVRVVRNTVDTRAGLERALAISEAVYGPDHAEVASALIYLGAIELGLGELRAARAGLERALAISEAVYGPDHPEVSKVLINLGAVQLELGEQDAGASIERALAISEMSYGPRHRKAIKTLIDLAVPRHEETAQCLISISLVLMSAGTRRSPENQQGAPDS